jgi:hypothetical protein
MPGHDLRNAWRRRIGCLMLSALFASAALAQSPQPSPAGPDIFSDMAMFDAFPPPPPLPPPDDGADRGQDVALLKVLVGTDGAARKVEAAPDNKASPELTKAASDAALKWHYPKQENGRTADAWVEVPVRLSLSLPPPHPPGPPPGWDLLLPPPPGGSMPPPPDMEPDFFSSCSS